MEDIFSKGVVFMHMYIHKKLLKLCYYRVRGTNYWIFDSVNLRIQPSQSQCQRNVGLEGGFRCCSNIQQALPLSILMPLPIWTAAG